MTIYPSDFPELDLESVVPSSLFLFVTIATGAILFAKEYLDKVAEHAKESPWRAFFLFVLGAGVFVYVLVSIAVQLEDAAVTQPILQMARSSLVLGMPDGPRKMFNPILAINVLLSHTITHDRCNADAVWANAGVHSGKSSDSCT
jgi:hypothetical protein